jgi:hypothetical protein
MGRGVLIQRVIGWSNKFIWVEIMGEADIVQYTYMSCYSSYEEPSERHLGIKALKSRKIQ